MRKEQIQDIDAGVIGETIRERRTYYGMSQTELAYRVGIHRATLLDIERGVKIPRLDVAARLSQALDFRSIDEMLGL